MSDSMPVPKPRYAELDVEVGLPWEHTGELRLHRIMHECRSLMRGADGDVQALLHDVLARALTRLDRYDDAESEYQEAIRLRPEAWPAFVNLGVLYLRMGRAPDAVEALLRADDRVPGNVRVLCNLAAALEFAGRPDDADLVFRDALNRMDPASPDNLWRAADAAAALGNHALAVELFARFNAVRLGRSMGEASAIAFVDSLTEAETDELRVCSEMLESLDYVRTFMETAAASWPDDVAVESAWDDDRARVMEEMGPLRSRANAERLNG